MAGHDFLLVDVFNVRVFWGFRWSCFCVLVVCACVLGGLCLSCWRCFGRSFFLLGLGFFLALCGSFRCLLFFFYPLVLGVALCLLVGRDVYIRGLSCRRVVLLLVRLTFRWVRVITFLLGLVWVASFVECVVRFAL